MCCVPLLQVLPSLPPTLLSAFVIIVHSMLLSHYSQKFFSFCSSMCLARSALRLFRVLLLLDFVNFVISALQLRLLSLSLCLSPSLFVAFQFSIKYANLYRISLLCWRCRESAVSYLGRFSSTTFDSYKLWPGRAPLPPPHSLSLSFSLSRSKQQSMLLICNLFTVICAQIKGQRLKL